MFKFKGNWVSSYSKNIYGLAEINLPINPEKIFKTELILTYICEDFRKNQTLIFELNGEYNNNKYVLVSSKPSFDQLFIISLNVINNLIEGYYNCFNPHDIGTIKLECVVKCTGCLQNINNQLGHMDYNGCLFDTMFY